MVKMKEVVWDKKAILQLEEVYNHIRKDSLQSAIKVRKSIKKTTRDLSKHPEIYSLDRFRKNNDGSNRAFEKYSYRVTY